MKLTNSGKLPRSLGFGSESAPPAVLRYLIRMVGSLKNHGADAEADAMFDMGAETMQLSMEEKMKFEQGYDGVSFG